MKTLCSPLIVTRTFTKLELVANLLNTHTQKQTKKQKNHQLNFNILSGFGDTKMSAMKANVKLKFQHKRLKCY